MPSTVPAAAAPSVDIENGNSRLVRVSRGVFTTSSGSAPTIAPPPGVEPITAGAIEAGGHAPAMSLS
jgi:hypothetical protein